MNINQSGSHNLVAGIDHLGYLGLTPDDDPSLHKEITNFIDPVCGVDDTSVLNVQGKRIGHVAELVESGEPPEQR